MIYLLDCNELLANCCTDAALARVLNISKNILDLIQLLVPIILIVMVSINIAQLVINPDMKNGKKKLTNKVIAALVVFFVPSLMGVILNMLPDKYQLGACWKSARTIQSDETQASYIPLSEGQSIKTDDFSNLNPPRVMENKDDNSSSSSSGNGGTANTGASGDGYPEGTYTASNGITYKKYRQDTGPWASNGYSAGTIASSGCGPTSVAILASGLVDSNITPAKTAADMGGAGNGGTNASKLQSEMNRLGMAATIKSNPTNSDIINALNNGQVMLVSVEADTIFTNGSHLMTVVDKNSKGQVYVINPNSAGRTSSPSGWYNPSDLTRASQYIITTPAKKKG